MGNFKSISIRAIQVIMIVLVSSSYASAQKWGKISDEEWAMSAPVDFPSASAIILFDIGKIEVTRDRIKIYYHTRIKILDQAGAKDAGEWTIEWHEKYDKIKSFKAHTITPDGKKHKIDKKAIFESKSGEWKTKKFAFSQLAPGVILEYKYIHISERFQYLRPWYFQNYLYTLRSQITTGVAAGFSYDVDFFNVPGEYRAAKEDKYVDRTANTSTPSYIKTFTWQMENLPPITDEPYMSARNDYRAFVRFQIDSFTYGLDHTSFVRTWPEEGKWFENYIADDYDKAGSRIDQLVEQLTANMTDWKIKSRAIFDWVSDSIRTTSDFTGNWFYQKNLAKLLDERLGFGEDKNYLIAKMHQSAGIDAWPVLISTRSNGKFNPHQGDLRQFNYLITLVQMGNEWEFLDASGRYSPYGVLPPNLLTEGGLLLDGNESDLVRIAIKPTNSYRFDSTMMVIDSTGQVTGHIECLFTGYYAAAISQIEQESESGDLIKRHFSDHVGAECEWTDPIFQNDNQGNLTETIEFSSPTMLSELGDNKVITPIRLSFGENVFSSQKRFFPVDFMYPFTYTNRVDIVCQADYSEIILPTDTSINMPGATFVRQSTISDSMATVLTQLTIEQAQFKPRQYDSLRAFFEVVALTKDDQVAFVK